MNIKSHVGNRIRALRKKQNISQEQLAYLCQLDRTYINGVENGKRNISIINLEKVAKSFNLGLKDFFDDKVFEKED